MTPISRARVLIVDDHAIVRNGLIALLAVAEDLEVVGEAENGAEAVRLAERLAPDLVLMDLSMPESDGVEATSAVKAKLPDARVLVLTSFAEKKWIVGAVAAGADGYLLKHSEPEVLLAAIRSVLGGGSPLDPRVARALMTNERADVMDPEPLTAREEEVLHMVTAGLANRAIAESLGITERTVKAHLTHIFARLGVRDRTQAALWVARRDAERGKGY
jgi:DNA-binding NarL/FixJ family response regulator